MTEFSPPRSPPRLMTAPEVAERLAVSVRTVWRLVSKGKLKARKIGGATRFAIEGVDALG